MAHLLLLGVWQGMAEVAARLHAEHAVTLVRRPDERIWNERSGFDLVLAEVDAVAGLDAVAALAKWLAAPWFVRCSTLETGAAAAAYRAGALAVLPGDTAPETVEQTTARLLATLHSGNRSSPATGSRLWQRHHRAGEPILLSPESVLEIEDGVVALTVLDADGAEVLLGLYGRGQMLTGHPEDGCCTQLYAHADAVVRIQPWTEAILRPGFSDRLRERLRFMEAWAAMQARPQIEQRLLGILSLLAQQFGQPVPWGTRIEVRVTHTQLASAVGATRSTVTRLLGNLRRRGLLLTERSGNGERFYLRDGEEAYPRRAAG
jgi:CRP-like cAMP-binding protein